MAMPLSELYRLAEEHPNNASTAAELHRHSSRFGHKGPTAAADDTIMNDFNQMSEPWFSYKMDTDNTEPVQHVSHATAAESSGDRVLFFKDSQHTLNQRYTSFSQRGLSSLRPNMTRLDQVSLFPSMKIHQTRDQEQRVSSSSVVNFPHFAAMVKPVLHGISSKPNPELPVNKIDNGKDKVFTPSQAHLDMSKSLEMLHQFGQDSTELVVASSDRASNDPSKDVKEESVDIKKAGNNRIGSGSKRSRAAEVHNLSARRRRDKINEKMRALQELIPNCNKVDNASMLDEAIEYLKSLQLKVQMMSMGHGACMNSMTLPYVAQMARFGSMKIPVFPMATVSQFGTLNANPVPNPPMFGSQALIRTTADAVHNAAAEKTAKILWQAEGDEPDGPARILKDDQHPTT